ncbi:hypothetical protein M885DRAFT_525936 [Pelagophyceae sp. CCMP2097]|nr:hypothetical protein M885DRAFT_525936 [Pelagophyceae sp. CCMP2097]
MEEYCQAGARCLATFEEQNIPSKFVCCEGGLQVNLERVALAAGAAGLVIERHLPVVGREGKPPLFGVWVFSKRENAAQRHAEPDVALVVRDLAGARTPEYLRLLGEMGMTP